MSGVSVATDAVFQRTFDEVRKAPGAVLFTVLQWIPQRSGLRRLYTTHPEAYPVGAEKTVEISPGWLGTVIEDKKPFLAPDLASLREVFTDSKLIQELGCGACINIPVINHQGTVVGVIALLDAEGKYTYQSVETAVGIVEAQKPRLLEAFAAHPAELPTVPAKDTF